MKILVIRFSSIGDIILCSPILRVLKEHYNAEIHFLTKANYQSILEHNPNVDRIICFEDSISDIRKEIRKEFYDAIIDLHKNIRTKLIAIGLPIAYFSFSKLNLKKWLLVNFGINRLPKIHLVDRYFIGLKDFQLKNDGLGLDYFYSEKDLLTAKSILKTENQVGISLGATYATKRLPFKRLLALCEKISQPIVLLGGEDVEEESKELEESLVGKTEVVNLVGQLKLNETAAIVDNLKLLVCYDSGLMHMRAAFKKPLISIWGNTHPSFGMYPYFGDFKVYSAQYEVSDLSCRPCSKLGHDDCPKKHFKCMEDHDVGRISKEIHHFFQNN